MLRNPTDRLSGIDVELEPDVADANKSRLDRCALLFEEFCIVT